MFNRKKIRALEKKLKHLDYFKGRCKELAQKCNELHEFRALVQRYNAKGYRFVSYSDVSPTNTNSKVFAEALIAMGNETDDHGRLIAALLAVEKNLQDPIFLEGVMNVKERNLEYVSYDDGISFMRMDFEE